MAQQRAARARAACACCANSRVQPPQPRDSAPRPRQEACPHGDHPTTHTHTHTHTHTRARAHTHTHTHARPPTGDYFVVSIYRDPDYGTALFSLDGGASSCQWEAGTARRATPTLAWEYIGPEVVKHDEAALFKLAVGNTLNYYDADLPSRPNGRPGWTGPDEGYSPLDMRLILGAILEDSVTVKVAGSACTASGLPYPEFGRGLHQQLVEVSRGLTAYAHAPIPLVWGLECGDDGTEATLAMANPDGEPRRAASARVCPRAFGCCASALPFCVSTRLQAANAGASGDAAGD